jgi:hypothetical protein
MNIKVKFLKRKSKRKRTDITIASGPSSTLFDAISEKDIS